MRIMLAGGNGYIGSVLASFLVERGYEVQVCDLCWFHTEPPPGTTLRKVDLFNLTEEDCRGFDQIIFLAGLSNDPMAELSPSKNFIYNAALPAYMAYIAKRAGVKRFIYASSCSVYGYSANNTCDEDGPVISGYPYGISKLQGERGSLYLADGAFSVISLRQGTVCGHSRRMRFDLVVSGMYRTAVTEGVIRVNHPSIWRPLIDIRDTAQAFVRAVQAPMEISGIFNVAIDNFLVGQIGDIVKDEVEKLLGRHIALEISYKTDYRNYKVSCHRAKETIGFMPRYGVADMVRNIHEHREEYGDMNADKYYNSRIFTRILLENPDGGEGHA